MDAADQLRLEQMLAEHAWAAFHIWDRTQRGIFPKGTFEATGGALLCGLLRTAGGATWWRSAKQTGFPPGFVLDVDAVLAKNGGASVVVNPTKEPPEDLTGRCSEPRPAPMRSFRVTSSSTLQPRALPGAVADLVSR